MGSGKSTVGRLVAERGACEFRDLDSLIEARLGRTIPEIFERDGEPAFREVEAAVLAGALEGEAVVALGGGAVVREDSWRLLRQRALSVYLEVPLAVLLERLGSGEGRPLLSGRGSRDIAQLFEERRARYEQADHRVAAGRPAPEVAAEVFELWRG